MRFASTAFVAVMLVLAVPDKGAAQPPGAPSLLSPGNGATDILLTPELQTGAFSDPDGDVHAQTQWQVSTDIMDFTDAIVLDVTSASFLTFLDVPSLVLNPETIYCWRVRFFDDAGEISPWSVPWSFTTGTREDDAYWDDGGGPVQTAVGDSQVTVIAGTNVAAVLFLEAVDPATIADNVNRPEANKLPLGLFGFKVRLIITDPTDPNYDPMAEVTIVLSEAGSGLCGWDPINGWQDLSGMTAFTPEETNWTEATVTLIDGGSKDADGVQNGIIVDPLGPLALAAGAPLPDDEEADGDIAAGPSGSLRLGSDDDDACFITTAGRGSRLRWLSR